jgi:hypothetical protein
MIQDQNQLVKSIRIDHSFKALLRDWEILLRPVTSVLFGRHTRQLWCRLPDKVLAQ